MFSGTVKTLELLRKGKMQKLATNDFDSMPSLQEPKWYPRTFAILAAGEPEDLGSPGHPLQWMVLSIAQLEDGVDYKAGDVHNLCMPEEVGSPIRQQLKKNSDPIGPCRLKCVMTSDGYPADVIVNAEWGVTW